MPLNMSKPLKSKYTIDNTQFPPSCLPTSLNTQHLIDITAVGDMWRRYMDISNGKIHDGAKYYAESLEWYD